MDNPSIVNITEQEFVQHESDKRLFQDEYARRFAKLIVSGAPKPYVLSWRSELIEPVFAVTPCGSAIYIGVDEHLACVASNGSISFSIDLNSTLLTIESTDTTVFAVCQLQLLVLGKSGSVERTVDFPDLVDQFALTDGSVHLSFMSGASDEVVI